MSPGTLGPYRLLAEIGSGGMGRVFRAEVVEPVPGLAPGQRVAVKVFHPHLFEVPGFFRRFLLEGRVGVDVTHPNVVRTFGCDAVRAGGEDHHLLVMELVEGVTLRQLLEEHPRVPEDLCLHVAREVARGLQAIHEAGIVHRDLKPENVLLTEGRAVKIMDLGLARLRDAALGTSPRGRFAGSIAYAAPEQFQPGGRPVDARADLHALGVILHELATGRHPFRDGDAHATLQRILHETPPRVRAAGAQVGPFLEEVIATLLAKEREDRFPSARDLVDVLETGEASRWWRDRALPPEDGAAGPATRRLRLSRETSVHGREEELALLLEQFYAAARGEGRVVLIEGEAGVGKSRLVDELVARLERAGASFHFLFGAHVPGGAVSAAGALGSALRDHFGDESLEATLRRRMPFAPHLAAPFAARIRGEPPPAATMPLTREAEQAAFVAVAQSLARERTTILLVEDLHFAPEEGRALFAAVAVAAAGERLLVLGTMRRGVPARWVADVERHASARHVALRRLWPAEVCGLLREALRSDRLARDLGRPIAHASGGNPFFAFELLRGLRDEGVLRQGPDGGWYRARESARVEIPPSLVNLVRGRVAGLSEGDREILDVAACCGSEFDPGIVAQVLRTEEVPLLRRLAALERDRALVRATGRTFAFDHELVQELVHAALPAGLREAYHAAIGDALEARHGCAGTDPSAVDGALCVDLCEHFLQGGRLEAARRYLVPAVSHLAGRHVDDLAVALCDRALHTPGLLAGEPRFEILLRKGACLECLGKEAERAATIAEALSIAEGLAREDLAARARHASGAADHGPAPRLDDARRDDGTGSCSRTA